MMQGRLGLAPTIPDNPLGLSWHDSAWIPILNTSNVMDYFSERSNPFFDRTCNNEIVKMQRLSPDQLQNMTGLEYVLLHVQEPILYVIRKQHRHSTTQTTPLADYYIIAGVVYQAPDLASVLNSRLLSAVHHLQSSFEEASSFSRYHPSKGYTWDFKTQPRTSSSTTGDRASTPGSTKSGREGADSKPREEPSSLFQRQRVDMLLGEMIRKYPLPNPIIQPPPKTSQTTTTATTTVNSTTTNTTSLTTTTNTNASVTSVTTTTPSVTVKTETSDNGQVNNTEKDKIDKDKNVKPPEKKPRLN